MEKIQKTKLAVSQINAIINYKSVQVFRYTCISAKSKFSCMCT